MFLHWMYKTKKSTSSNPLLHQTTMFIKFTREGIWWLTNKLDNGQLQQFSFVWPMVLQWLEDQVKKREDDHEV